MTENGTSIAVISPRGGAICKLLFNDFELVPDFLAADPLDYVYGHTLAPWPNRLEDASYEFRGTSYQFEDHDAQHNKNHGLLLTEDFEIREHLKDRLTLGYRFGEHPGYPFEIDLEIQYALTDKGFEVAATAMNLGNDAPFAIGFHPYFLTRDHFRLQAKFSSKSIQNERMLPVGTEVIAGLDLDQDSKELADLDHLFEGANRVSIAREDGALVVEAIENLPFFMAYRPKDQVASEPVLAIEPQSAKANVFSTDIESVVIPSGEQKTYSFQIRRL